MLINKMDLRHVMFFNELLMDSSDSSDDDMPRRNVPGGRRVKIEGYVEHVVDRYSEEEFRENFRMYRTTFNHILSLIIDKIASQPSDIGHHTLSSKTQLLIAIWYFATPDSYRSICGRFNIGKATGLRTVRRVAQALFELSPTIIKWPIEGAIELNVNGFLEKGFPNTLGCIDGTHIPIPQPQDHGISYICRKGYASTILQAVCDHQLMFIHCYAGECGSCHDGRVLRQSELSSWLRERAGEKFPRNTHLLGDKAYPCWPHLITPYKNNGHLTREQINFNRVHARTRSSIERAFALLKLRFRCLKDLLDVRKLDWIPIYIISCCVLHNICIMQGDILNFEEVEENVDINDLEGVAEREIERELSRQGQEKRDALCLEINENM